ncbi:DUF4333 domain-containing protein [Amycolatopsis sp. cmx-11-32]|uniref:DUF4333 domain-containing protein n=1 Tax=Amycolatopsis sp. cmx-11-32 TaxID=2785796 RepID=UPI0039E6D269
MTEPQRPQQPQQPQQWWQPPANPGNQQQEEQATGPHSGQWQQNDPNAASTGSYTGQWQQQPGVTGSFSGPWQQTGASAPGTAWQQQPAPQQDWQAQQQIPGPPPQGQYGGGFQPAQSSHYGGLGAFGAQPEKKPKVSKKTLLIGGIAAAVVVAGGVGAWLLGAFAGDSLDQKSVQDGVTRVLSEHYGEPDVKNVACPSGQPVENGTTFDCSIDLSGQQKKVTVRVLNTTPEFEVGAPH